MLNLDAERFLKIQEGAMALANPLHATLADCLNQGAANIFFLGSGGAGILMYPAARLLGIRSTFPVHVEMPAELVLTGSPAPWLRFNGRDPISIRHNQGEHRGAPVLQEQRRNGDHVDRRRRHTAITRCRSQLRQLRRG